MTASLMPVPKVQFFDDNGDPLSGGKAYFYAPGTATPKDTYSDFDGTTPNPNPVILDARGEAVIRLVGSYDIILKSATDVTIYSVSDVGLGDAGSFAYTPTIGGSDRTVASKLAETVSVKDFGVVGDYDPDTDIGTDDTANLQAAITYAKANNVTLFVPKGYYRVTDELDCWVGSGSTIRWGIVGEGRWTSVFVVDFVGHDKALFKGVEDTPSQRAFGQVTFSNFRCEVEDTALANPMYINFGGYTELRHESLTFGGSSNTHAVWSSSYNSQIKDVVSYGGGHSYLYKATDGITFSISAAGTTLTASAAVFDAGDVGKHILIAEASGDAEMFEVATYTDTTNVEVTVASNRTLTASVGTFEDARCAMTAASTTLTADASCFTAADAGRLIYVDGAGTNSGLLAARIVSASGTGAVLDTAAVGTVSDVMFCTPHTAIAQDPAYLGTSASSAETNDLSVEDLHIENFHGVGLVVDKASDINFTNIKIHGDSSPTDTGTSLHHVWLNRAVGHLTGWLEARTCGRGGRIHSWDQKATFDIPYVRVRFVAGQQLVTSHAFDAAGLVKVGTVDMIGDVPAAAREGITDGETGTDPRVFIEGPVSSPERAPMPFPVTNPNGGTFQGWYEEGSGTVTLYGTTTAGSYGYTRQTMRYTRIGRMVFFTTDLLLDGGAHTAGTGDMRISGLPYLSVNASSPHGGGVANWKVDLTNTGANLTWVIPDNADYIALYECYDAGTQDTLDAADIVADSRFVISGHYEVAK